MVGELKPQFQQYNNRPIIIKDHFKIFGSDTAQIGWVETTDEAGQVGFSWYLKAAGETRLRFEDYLETAMLEAEEVVSGNLDTSVSDADGTPQAGINGSEGFFAAVESRGNVFEDLATLADFDLVLKNLDKQGAIEENMLYMNRSLALTFDDMMAGLNASYPVTVVICSLSTCLTPNFGTCNAARAVYITTTLRQYRRRIFTFTVD